MPIRTFVSPESYARVRRIVRSYQPVPLEKDVKGVGCEAISYNIYIYARRK